jgi:hypothetical protein
MLPKTEFATLHTIRKHGFDQLDVTVGVCLGPLIVVVESVATFHQSMLCTWMGTTYGQKWPPPQLMRAPEPSKDCSRRVAEGQLLAAQRSLKD